MTQAANHITSQVRKMQENTLMVCRITLYHQSNVESPNTGNCKAIEIDSVIYV